MKKLLFVLATVLVFSSCGGGESNSNGGEMSTSSFFDRYLNTLCNAASKCMSGLVNAENVSSCPRTIFNSSKPFEGFHK